MREIAINHQVAQGLEWEIVAAWVFDYGIGCDQAVIYESAVLYGCEETYIVCLGRAGYQSSSLIRQPVSLSSGISL